MVRKKKEPNHIDAMLDDLLADCEGPEDILGEAGLLKQLSQRLVERALAGELSHHLAHDEQPSENASRRRNRAMLISGVWRGKKEGRILLDNANHQIRNTP